TDLRKLIMEIATSKPTWGQKRIANELLLKIGIQISPRTVRRYMPNNPKRPTVPSRRWTTFGRNHAKAIITADFFVVSDCNVPARVRVLDHGDRDAFALEHNAASDSGMDCATVS